MNHTRNVVFVFTSHRNNIAVPAQSNDRLPQVFSIAGRGDDLLKAFTYTASGYSHMPTDIAEF